MVKIAGLIAHFERASRSNARSPVQNTPLALIRKDSFFRRQSTFSPKKDRIYRQNGSALLFAVGQQRRSVFRRLRCRFRFDDSDSEALFEPMSPQSPNADSPASRAADSTFEKNGRKFKILSASVRQPTDNNDDDDDDEDDDGDDDEIDDEDNNYHDNSDELPNASALRELIATERTYAARLDVLVDDVLLVVRERHLMSDEQCRTVFGNIEQVRECAARFLAAVAQSTARPARHAIPRPLSHARSPPRTR
jgi:hypothetical protein